MNYEQAIPTYNGPHMGWQMSGKGGGRFENGVCVSLRVMKEAGALLLGYRGRSNYENEDAS